MILGIESSCDDTGIALIDDNGEVLLEKICSQFDLHAKFGGVVPELASRAHTVNLQSAIQLFRELIFNNVSYEEMFSKEKSKECNLKLICVTTGPGLLGSLISGFAFGLGLSKSLNVPLMAINHIEAHLLSIFIENPDIKFPFLSAIVSGGHCQIILAKSLGKYVILGETMDDSPGEVFDKIGRLLNIPYPAGAKMDEIAQNGDKNKYTLPLPTFDVKYKLSMSFSGLKTASITLIRQIQQESNTLNKQIIADFCSSFNFTMERIFRKKLDLAVNYVINELGINIKNLCICGGVAANTGIRKATEDVASKYKLTSVKPSIKYCTDNATMIANAGFMRNNFLNNEKYIIRNDMTDLVNFSYLRPNWSLDEL